MDGRHVSASFVLLFSLFFLSRTAHRATTPFLLCRSLTSTIPPNKPYNPTHPPKKTQTKRRTITKDKLNWRIAEQKRQRENSERENFTANKTKWLADSQEVMDKIVGKYNQQQYSREQKIQRREELKKENMLARVAMRAESVARSQEEARLEAERQRAKREEELREARERFNLSCSEADQRVVDRFWGIPTEAEKKRRLEEFHRRQFEKRVNAQRAMMVAVGGEISVSSEVALETPDILGIDKRFIRTLNRSTSEMCSDPLGIRSKRLGQR